MKLDDLLETSINQISEKISDVENLYLQIAAVRLKKIYCKTPEELQNYMYSAEFIEDTQKDIRKIKRILEKVHKQNINEMTKLYKSVIKEAIDVGNK